MVREKSAWKNSQRIYLGFMRVFGAFPAVITSENKDIGRGSDDI